MTSCSNGHEDIVFDEENHSGLHDCPLCTLLIRFKKINELLNDTIMGMTTKEMDIENEKEAKKAKVLK